MSMPSRGEAATASSAILCGLVGRIVEHLDLEPVARVVDATDGVDQAIGDVHLVVQRQLDGDDRRRIERDGRNRILPRLLMYRYTR